MSRAAESGVIRQVGVLASMPQRTLGLSLAQQTNGQPRTSWKLKAVSCFLLPLRLGFPNIEMFIITGGLDLHILLFGSAIQGGPDIRHGVRKFRHGNL